MILQISIYGIILGLISVLFLLTGILKFIRKEKNQSLFKLLATTIIWGGVFILSFFPNIAHIISVNLGLGENLNTLIFLGFVIIFFIIFKLLNQIEKMEHNISEIVRNEALEKLNNLNKKL